MQFIGGCRAKKDMATGKQATKGTNPAIEANQTTTETVNERCHVNKQPQQNSNSNFKDHLHATTTEQSGEKSQNQAQNGASLDATSADKVGRRSPNPPRKLTPRETLAECERESNELESRVEGLVNVQSSRSAKTNTNEYRFLEELTMRVILKLDELDCSNDGQLRAERKRVVQHAQRVLEKLEQIAHSTS